jgi:hypothetical protein
MGALCFIGTLCFIESLCFAGVGLPVTPMTDRAAAVSTALERKTVVSTVPVYQRNPLSPGRLADAV